ncbi:hypothetical protein N9A87_01120, partial [Euryarchaeota archaeon]|nr:hypothetical protein [Euryarchaeota archaeon]
MSAWTSSRVAAGSNPDWQQRLTDSLEASTGWSNALQPLVHHMMEGLPLTLDEGMVLYAHPNLNEVGRLAHMVRAARFDDKAFFNSNVHVNQTNVCVLACKFCAFRRSKKASDAYALDIDAYLEDLSQYADHVDEVHSVGGLHPDWGVE